MAKKFEGMNKGQLNSRFSSKTFEKLSKEEKQSLLQAYVDQKCKEDGLDPVKVELEPMAGMKGGEYRPGSNTIVMNEYLVCGGGYLHNGKAIMVDDSNYRTLEVTLHEYRHAWQNAVVSGKVQATEEQLRDFQSNQFTTSPVLNNTATGSQYVQPNKNSPYGNDVYFLNPVELDAFRTSQEEVKAVLQDMPDDDAKKAYLDNLQYRGWEARLNHAQDMLGRYSDDVEKDMKTVLQNNYYGTKEPVNKEFQNVVETEMANTHQNLTRQKDVEKNRNMGLGLDRFDGVQNHAPAPAEKGAALDLDAFDRSQQGTVIDHESVGHEVGSEKDDGGITHDSGGLTAHDGGYDNDNGNDNGMDISM